MTEHEQQTAAAGPQREGDSRSADSNAVGVNHGQATDGGRQGTPQPGGEMKQPNERDESPADQTGARRPDNALRRGDPGVPVVGQAYEDVARGLQDTDLYGSGNLASPDDKGRRPDAAVDRADDNDVRRSGHDVAAG